MSTSERTVIETGRRRRRRHSALFKAEAVGACQQAGVSIAAVALARGLNANMLRDWVRKAERNGRPIAIRPTEPSSEMPGTDGFMPVSLPPSPAQSAIRIEVRRNGRSVSIEWPASAAHECALLLRELVK
jgi:transposase-like protein